MAEPARKLNPEDEDSRYLSAAERAAQKWGMDGSSPEQGEPDEDGDEGSTARERADKRWGMTPDEVKESEENPQAPESDDSESEESSGGSDQVGKGYNPEKKKKPGASRRVAARVAGMSTAQKLGGGLVGIIIGTIIAAMIIITPILKLESFLSSINQRVFGYATNAVQARIKKHFEKYLITQVHGLKTCTAKISIDCRVNYKNDNTLTGKVQNLYASWQDAKVEQKLFDDMGFQIEKETNPSGGYQFTLRDRLGKSVKLSNDGDVINLVEGKNSAGKREIGNQINAYLKQETKWYEVMQRVHVRRTLTRKDGVQFYCFWLCKSLDNIQSKIADAKVAFKLKLVERVVYPFSEKYGLIMDCFIKSGCSQDKINEIRDKFNVSKLTDEEAEKVASRLTKDGEDKAGQTVLGDIGGSEESITFTQFIVQELVTRVFNETTAKQAVDLIPVAGQIYLAVTIVDKLDQIDQFINNGTLSKIAAAVSSSQYLQYYSAMRSANDEMKTGKLPLDKVGATMDSFNGADQSLVYKQYNSPSGVTQADRNNANYKCDDGKPIPAGQLVCPEKKVTRTFAVQDFRNSETINNIAKTLDTYGQCITPEVFGHCTSIRPRTIIRPIINTISTISGFVTNLPLQAAFAAAKHIPGVSDFYNAVQKQIGNVIQFFFDKVFPLPIKPDSPGRDKYDGLEAGGEVAAKDFAEGGSDSQGDYGLGGEALTPQQAGVVMQQYNDQQNFEYQHGSLYARLTDLSRPNSFASLTVRSLPTSLNQAVTSFASALGNIFNGKLFSSFGNMLLVHTGQAHAEAPVLDPFGVPTYGYPVDDPSMQDNAPADYTPQQCAAFHDAREKSKTVDPNTFQEEYHATDPCMLDDTAVEAAGAYFTNN